MSNEFRALLHLPGKVAAKLPPPPQSPPPPSEVEGKVKATSKAAASRTDRFRKDVMGTRGADPGLVPFAVSVRPVVKLGVLGTGVEKASSKGHPK